MSVIHDSNSVSKSQLENINLVSSLVDFLNSKRPSHFTKTILIFEDGKYKTQTTGYLHKFLLNDSNKFIKNTFSDYKSQTFKKIKDDINLRYITNSLRNKNDDLKEYYTLIIKYFNFKSDLLQDDEFTKFNEDLKTEILSRIS